MSTELLFVLACGVLALVYGFWASRSVLAADAGSERMQEIAAAIQEGAQAYLNRGGSVAGGKNTAFRRRKTDPEFADGAQCCEANACRQGKQPPAQGACQLFCEFIKVTL